MKNRSASDGRKDLYLREMVRRVEHVERAIPHLEKVHVLLVDAIFAVADHERTGVGLRTEQEIDKSSVQKLLFREETRAVLHVGAFGAVHAALGNAETRGEIGRAAGRQRERA